MTRKRRDNDGTAENSWIGEVLEITAYRDYDNLTRRELVRLKIPTAFLVTDIPPALYSNHCFSITMARSLQELNRHEDAIYVYQHIQPSIDPSKQCTTLISMGRCFQEMKRYQEAEHCFVLAKEYKPYEAESALEYLNKLTQRPRRKPDSQAPVVDEQQDVGTMPNMSEHGFFARNPSHVVAEQGHPSTSEYSQECGADYPDEVSSVARDFKFRIEPYAAEFPWIVYPDLNESHQGPK